MAKLTFRGGIHPYDGKDLSKDKSIIDLIPGSLLIYPLSQHIGAPAKSIVSKGDHVFRGQMIAEGGGFVSAPVFASVSGIVKAIEPRKVATGDFVMSIVIENDGKYEEEFIYDEANPEELYYEEILERIQYAGIVGMGGAGFPTHVKLSPKDPYAIDYIIVNGAECEPYLTSDYRVMLEESEKVLGGLRIILSLFPDAYGILGIEDNKPECIKLYKQLVSSENRISVRALKTKYPQGGERTMIYALTGRKINSTMLPADVGVIVNNVDTVVAVYDAVAGGRPLMERIVTVTGDCIEQPRNYRVPIGMSYTEVLEAAGGFCKEPEKIICGGPMMGFAMPGTDVPVTKTSTALLAFSKDAVAATEAGPCINCGRCLEVCPGRVMPSKLANAAEHFDEETFLKYHGLECCECGCCSYICPAKRHLTQEIKTMRKTILAKKKK